VVTGVADVFPLLTGEDLAAMPAPSYLVDGLLPEVGLTEVFGASGAGKSFLALDLALCVAAEVPWPGRAVSGGWVIYVVAEGLAGFGARYRAWTAARGVDSVPRFRVLPEAVNLLDSALVDRLDRTLATLPEPPALVVVDTMARSMAGGDENSAQDVGRFVAAVDGLVPDGARLVVHHAGHEGDRERGSTALRAAADVVMQMRSEGAGGGALALTCAKAKDLAPFVSVRLRLEASADSVVLAGRDEEPGTQPGIGVRDRVLRALEAVETPASQNAVREAAGANKRAVAQTLRELAGEGLVVHGPDGWSLVPEPQTRPAERDRFRETDEAVPSLGPEPADPADPHGPTGPGNGGAVVPDGGGPIRPPHGTAPEPTSRCAYPVESHGGDECGTGGRPIPDEATA